MCGCVCVCLSRGCCAYYPFHVQVIHWLKPRPIFSISINFNLPKIHETYKQIPPLTPVT